MCFLLILDTCEATSQPEEHTIFASPSVEVWEVVI